MLGQKDCSRHVHEDRPHDKLSRHDAWQAARDRRYLMVSALGRGRAWGKGLHSMKAR